MGWEGMGQEWRRALPWLLPLEQCELRWLGSIPAPLRWLGGQGDVGRGLPIPSASRRPTKAACSSDPVCVGAGDPEVSPTARSQLGCPTYRHCLLTNKGAARSPGREGLAGEQQTTGAETQEPPKPLTRFAPPRACPNTAQPQHPSFAYAVPARPTVPPCLSQSSQLWLPDKSPCSCPCPQPVPPSSPHTCPARPGDTHLSRRTTPSMHAPKSTTELMSAGQSRRAWEVQSPPHPPCLSPAPHSRTGSGTQLPCQTPAQSSLCPAATARGASPTALPSPEGYRPQRWWRWPGWCLWGWTSARPAGPRSGWSQP